MNLFILSLSQKNIAKYMMDKHVSKILLEAVQMLCTTKRIVDPDDNNDCIYKIAHKNHPVTKWCRESRENFMWVLILVEKLHNEWKFRYNHPKDKYHKSYLVALYIAHNIPSKAKFEKDGLTPFALAMPEKYKCKDPVKAYRDYYMSPEKQVFASWNKQRNKPYWYIVNKKI